MKQKIFLLLLCLEVFTFSSCIREEALNDEADITSCMTGDSILIRDPIITNDKITLYIKDSVDITKQKPEFTLTEGATISPASGTLLNFSTPQKYTVTSQDGKWKKTYTVEYVYSNPATIFHFENVKYYTYPDPDTGKDKNFFQIFYDQTGDSTNTDSATADWGSGNAGYMITNSDAAPTDYPTYQGDDGFIGKCAVLETRSTGPLGIMFKAPLAAGNLFTGTFEVNMANMAKSTHFGTPFYHVPTELVGYYKYKSGPVFTDANSNVIKGKKDEFNIYAVFFDTSNGVDHLDGTNSLTSDQIVSKARISGQNETDTWTRFVIPSNLIPAKPIDANKLKKGKYSIAIIMSSSSGGATFNGAVGSTLKVDEMQLFYKADNK